MTDSFLNIALPKGRIGQAAYRFMEKAGYECSGVLDPVRKLTFENPDRGIRYFWVKPSDVPVYVERGTADAGIAGEDILLEYHPDVYELVDLGIGKCRMCVAGRPDFVDNPSVPLTVASKFTHIAREYYRQQGRQITLIKLNGSVELAPLLGLSDVIVDLVETGTTLRENGLVVLKTIIPVSARFIVNKVSYKFRYEALKSMADALSREAAAGKED